MIRIFFFTLLSLSGFLQSDVYLAANPGDASKDLERLFIRLASVRDDKEKLRINDSIRILLDNYSESDSVFSHKFANIKNLGQITSKNSSLKILTWNMLLRESPCRYYCYFIHNEGKTNHVYRLEAPYSETPVTTDRVYSEEDWYGALYYDMRAYRKDNQIYWILLGLDFGNPAVTRKIIEVLSISPEGGLIFGKELFSSGDYTKFREVLEYSSGAVVSLKFVNEKSIVFDHLVPFSAAVKGNREFYGPDFSYDGYFLTKGIWKFRSDVDVRNKRR